MSNRLIVSDAPLLSSIAKSIVASMPELISNEPVNLFSLNNSMAVNSWGTYNDIDN